MGRPDGSRCTCDRKTAWYDYGREYNAFHTRTFYVRFIKSYYCSMTKVMTPGLAAKKQFLLNIISPMRTWNIQPPRSSIYFLRKFHEVRYEQYQRQFISDIKDDNKKLTVYKLIKNDYRIEPHLIYLNNKNHQRALTRLRVSSHKLNIELGRHSRPPIPRANRLCNFCNSKEVDDEIHFLTKCELHSEARYHLFDEIQRHQHISHNLSPENLYQCVMTSKSDKVLAAIAKFTYFGLKRRDNLTEGWY